ncbi:MAG: tRNA (5-methylaminomethyl-2-thiouridine)(34)-methyltransferase MnmD [Pseudomonadota bacterium]
MPSLTWRGRDVPVSTQYDDPYYSMDNGWQEAGYVFVDGNDLATRLEDGFSIAELGFGTGLNLLAAWSCWRASAQQGTFSFTSFEAHPLDAEDMARALHPFDVDGKEALVRAWADSSGESRILEMEGLRATVFIGPVELALPKWTGQADAWFLDGFAPSRNPQMWTSQVLHEVARHTRPKGTIATYTAASAVRRGLEDAGFAVERLPGFGRKRHMLRGALL